MKFFKILVALIFTKLGSIAQTSGQLIEASLDIKIPFTVTQFYTKHGLPQNQVIDIVAKNNGALILSTADGIVEFNGTEFKPVTKNNSYKKHFVTKLLWDEETKSLFGYNLTGDFVQILPRYEVSNSHASCIYQKNIYSVDSAGTISISSIKNFSFKKKYHTNLKRVHSIYHTSSFFLLGTSEGIFKFDPLTNDIKKIATDDFILIKENSYSKEVYILSTTSVYKFNALNSTLSTLLKTKDESIEVVCQDIEFLNENEFFLATTNGLYHYDGTEFSKYTKKSALPSQYIQSLLFNKNENCLFVGTGDKGLLKLQLKNCYSFSSNQGFNESASLTSIIQTKNEGVLVTESNRNIFKLGIDTVFEYSPDKGSYSSLAEINDTIYAGTWGGGLKLFKKHLLLNELIAPKNLPQNNVHAIFKDSRSAIWVGTGKGIAKGLYSNNLKPYLQDKIKGIIICFYELKNGNVCIGGTNGIYILDTKDNLILHIDKAMGLECREVRSFYEDKTGKLWIGTYDGGLYCYFKNKLTSINKLKNSKIDKDVFCLANDNFGYIYMTSNHGLWRVKESDLNDFYYGKKEFLVPFHYGEETGILNTEFNGGFQNNFLKTKRDHFYFPSIQGLVIVTPEEIPFRKLTSVIDRVWINDTLQTKSDNTFRRNTYSIKFDFSCISFLEKYNIHFQYKLKSNVNDNFNYWSPLEKTTSVSFKILQPGKYTFSLRAVDAFNYVNPVAEYSFEIEPYYYETFWFKISSAILFLLLTIIVGRIRIQSYRRKAEEKEFYRRSMAELELKAIQAQLNPHFIFNCLNTIKFFILDNDFEKANKGLNHFSKMLRDVINNSESPIITLKNEITFLTDYLELEKMRLVDKLDFIIKSKSEDQAHKIPGMLIQPHIENAIKHGIGNLIERKGELIIEFIMHFMFLEIRIKDNGIGRVASLKLNKRPNHISKGINLTLEKSRALKKLNKAEITTEIIDLYNQDHEAEGTLAIIKIPFYENSYN